MSTVIRVMQAILLLAALGACGYAAVMVIEATDDANTECFRQEAQRSGLVQEQQIDVCVGLDQFQVAATGAIAIAIAGLTAAAGAAALNGMVQPRAGAGRPAAGSPTATPPGGVQQAGGYPAGQYSQQAGQYPPAGQYSQQAGQYPPAGQGQYGQQPPGQQPSG